MTIGGATQDIIVQYDQQEMLHLNTIRGEQAFLLLEEGKKIELNKLSYYTGGGATNSAVSFLRLGFDVKLCCKIGTDANGDFVLKQLEKEKINTRFVARCSKTSTGTSVIIPSISGDRTILAFRGANIQLSEQDIPYEIIKKCDWLYITSLSGKASQQLDPITKYAQKNGIRVANNPGISQLAEGAVALRRSLKNIDIVILNAQEANEFMQSLVQTDQELKNKVSQSCKPSAQGTEPSLISSPICFRDIQFNIRDFLQEVLSQGPKIVAVTNGAEGVYVATDKTIFFHPSIAPEMISNTLGAGDAFGSCFVAQIALGKPVPEALRAGIVNSSSVISFLDAKTGLLSHQELKKQQKVVPEDLIQQYKL